MPLQISNYNIDFLSGPRSITCLTPNVELYKLLDSKDVRIPPILLLSDQHESIEGTCNELRACNTNKANCVSLLKEEWFKLLDSLCVPELKIDYFIETNFPTVLMDNIADERLSNMFTISSDVMMYLPINYFQCFQNPLNSRQNKKITPSPKCITDNIRYHFMDTRYDLNYFNLKAHELEIMFLTNMSMRQNVYATEEINSLIKRIKNRVKETSVEMHLNAEFNFIENNPIFVHYDQLHLARHLPNFESYLSYCLDNLIEPEFYSYTQQFYSERTFDLIIQACFNPEQFITKLIQLPQFKYHSLLYKQIAKSVFKEEVLIKMFVEYYCFCISKETSLRWLKQTIKETAFEFESDMHNASNPQIRERVSKDSTLIKEASKRLKSQYYLRRFIKDLGGILVAPFMDFYFLCRSWKTSIINNSQLCIFHAGVRHTATLKKFLANYKMFFDVQFDVGYDALSDTSNSLPIKKRLTYNPSSSLDPIEYKLFQEKTDLIRCLEFKKNVVHSIDQVLYFSYLSRDKQKLSKIDNLQKLNKARKTFFGSDVYNKILLGHKLTQDEFKLICDHHNLTTQDAIKKFNLKVISEVSFSYSI